MNPFLRQVEVLIGPTEEWRGGGNERQSIRLVGDGSSDNFAIKFTVNKHVISTASPSIIQVYNLSQALRESLRSSETKIVLRAGWKNTGLVQVFTGSLLYVSHQREGADIITNLISLAGYGGMSRTIISATFADLTKVRDIVKAFAMQIPGVTVDDKLIDLPDLAAGSQGWSFAGPVNAGLDKLSRSYKFDWWINNGVFYALGHDKTITGTVKLSSENGFLMRVEPMLATPMQKQIGVSIQSLFNPYVEPGRIVEVESAVNPRLNGRYKVHTLYHSGDTHSTQWTTSIDSWVIV